MNREMSNEPRSRQAQMQAAGLRRPVEIGHTHLGTAHARRRDDEQSDGGMVGGAIVFAALIGFAIGLVAGVMLS